MQCKHRSPLKIMETRQCERPSVKDGYCTRHHPNYISPQQRKAEAAHLAEMNQGPRDKLVDAIEAAKREVGAAREALSEAHANHAEASCHQREAETALLHFDYPFLNKQARTP